MLNPAGPALQPHLTESAPRPSTRRQLLVIWHSVTGGAHAMAQAFVQGARAEPDLDAHLMPAAQVQACDVLAADGLAFICPEMLGGLSGLMKDFFDRTYYPVLGQVEGRPYALLVCAGSDGSGAVRQLQRIATGWRLREVAPPLIVCTHAQTPQAILAPKTLETSDLQRCQDSGQAFAAGLAMGLF